MKFCQIFCVAFLSILAAFILNSIYLYTQIDTSIDFQRFYEKEVFKGYPIESHYVIAQDNYIIQSFRIQAKYTKIVSGKKPIMLIHGLAAASDSFMLNSYDNQSIPYILANEGYDVWLLNLRGNFYSRNHTVLNPDNDIQFWDFTFQQSASYDLPDTLEYIYNITKQTTHCIGYSQGATIIIAALAEQNVKANKYIDKVILLGPAGVSFNMQIIYLFNVLKQFDGTKYEYRDHTKSGYYICKLYPYLTQIIFNSLMDMKESPVAYEKICGFLGVFPSGTSVLSYNHWEQMYDQKRFGKFDYKETKNKLIYNSVDPPSYDLAKITKELLIVTGVFDQASPKKDTDKLINQLINAKIIAKELNLGHVSFILNNNMSYVNEILVPYLK